MDIETRKKISRAMKGHSNFEGHKHTHAEKIQIAISQEGHKNAKDHKWAVDKETGKETRIKGGKGLPRGSRWGRTGAFSQWIHTKEETLPEHIVRIGNKYRLVSKKTGKNLGTFDTRADAEQHEREVQFFKHMGEDMQDEQITNDEQLQQDYTDHIVQMVQQDKAIRDQQPQKVEVASFKNFKAN